MYPRPFRILQIANQPGPLYLFMLPLCQALQRREVQVELACMPVGPLWRPLNEAGFPVWALPTGRWSSPWTWWRLMVFFRTFFKTHAFDMVIVHTPAISWLVRPFAHRKATTVIYFSHGLPFHRKQLFILRFFFRLIEQSMARFTDGLFVMNQEDATACLKFRLTRSSQRCFCIPGVGIDSQEYAKPALSSELHDLETSLGLRSHVPMVLFLGRFIPAKRPGDVLELARRLGTDTDYVLAGEGPLWSSVHRQAHAIGPHVHVLNFTDQTRLLLQRCTLLVLPSVYREGLPRVLLEAQAAGKPVVAYDVRGSRDVILHEKTGFLVAPRDLDGLARAVKTILDSQALARKMGEWGQYRMLDGFSLDKSLSATMSALENWL